MHLKRLRNWSAGALLLAALAPYCLAQIKSSTITGTLTDASGAAVADAAVSVREQATNATAITRSGSAGEYTVPFLAPGKYAVRISKTGFEPYSATDLEVGGSQVLRLDAKLTVGGVSTTVSVRADAAQLQTESAAVSGAVGAEAIQSIPNLNSNALYYATLQPGVTSTAILQETQTHDSFGIGYNSHQFFSEIQVNGGESEGNDILLDGTPIVGAGLNDANVIPNPEGLQEVRVFTSLTNAEYGRGEGVITMISKSGGNQYHGSAYYRIRNEDFNANSFGNNQQGTARPAFKADYYGGSAGGPILKDRLFFFASYEGLIHHNGEIYQFTVPTDLERAGDYSQTFIPENDGTPVPAHIYDPFNVTPLGNGNYQRAEVPGANLANLGRGPNPFAVKLYSYYPEPNFTANGGPPVSAGGGINAYHTNNFFAQKTSIFKKNSVNSRVDWNPNAMNSVYGTFGIFQGSIAEPRAFGDTFYYSPPFYSQHDKDKNPYASIGDTVVLNSSTVVDVRYGATRINTDSDSDSVNFDYASVGIPASVSSQAAQPGAAPDHCPEGTNSALSCLGNTEYQNKKIRQTTHNFVGSVSKSFSRVTSKIGVEYRVNLANFTDPYESVTRIDTSAGNYSYQTITANGSPITSTATNTVNGYGGADLLLGAGDFATDGGSVVKPALSAKYFAIYSQNDWHPNARTTVNLGLRWEVQPAPTDRYNRMSSFDATAPNIVNGLGALAFPGRNGYSRGLWDTRYDNWSPHFGVSFLATPKTVARGGVGITYTPTNTGYYDGPALLGTIPFSSAQNPNPYGSTPNGVPVGTYDTGLTTQILQPVGGDRTNPAVYGNPTTIFDRRNYRDGRIYQWNFFLERQLPGGWLLSAGYVGSHGEDLQAGPRNINGYQTIDDATLASWRQTYIDSGSAQHNPGNDTVTNPFNPNGTLPFSGVLANSQISQYLAKQAFPLFPSTSVFQGGIVTSTGNSDYHGLQVTGAHAFSNGFLVQGNYVWSKQLDTSATVIANNGVTDGNAFYLTEQEDIRHPQLNRKYSFADIPNRFTANFRYDLPFGRGKTFGVSSRLADLAVGGWSIGGVAIAQSGTPLRISNNSLYGASFDPANGALNQRPDRVKGAAVELPRALQHIYDGNTTVTLPSGRSITPCANCYLKYNPDLFHYRVLSNPDGSTSPDIFWYGNAALDYGDIRGPGHANLDVTVDKRFNITERVATQLSANFTNVLNHTEFTAYQTGFFQGNPDAAGNPTGAISNGSGSHGLATFDPRQIQLNLRVTF